MKQNVMGVAYDNVTMQEALARARELLASEGASIVVTPNAEIAYDATKDANFCALLNRADLILPDGAGVVLAAKIRKTPLKEKVAGFDFATNLLPILAETGAKLYLLGSKPGIAALAAARMKEAAPGLDICGMRDGYFQDEAAVVDEINRSGAEALFVCLGAPKQERFMFAHKDEFATVRLMAGLGGTLDGFAGTVKRAPDWMIRLNLEWFYRLVKQPRRLGRMMRLPKYLCKAIGSRQ